MFCALLTACGSYDVKLNDRVVYTPHPLLSDFSIADAALSSCVKRHIQAQQISHVSQFTELECPNANIETLAGLEVFHALEHLDLSNNRIVDINTLVSLTRLRNLNLAHNRVQNVAPLINLAGLRHIRLTANAHLLCEGVRFGANVTVEAPKHC